MSMIVHAMVALQLQSICRIDLRYCNENTMTLNCNGLGGLNIVLQYDLAFSRISSCLV